MAANTQLATTRVHAASDANVPSDTNDLSDPKASWARAAWQPGSLAAWQPGSLAVYS
ncbi:MAG TPA: hypothetical protein VF040_21475 [Ktedonobacterales bacterium]